MLLKIRIFIPHKNRNFVSYFLNNFLLEVIIMKEENYQELKAQLEEYRQEKERVRKIVGQIGGTKSRAFHKIINQVLLLVVFMVIIIGIIFKNIFYEHILLVCIFLILIKLVWLVNEQNKIKHFQFWILSSLENKLNVLDKQVSKRMKNKGS